MARRLMKRFKYTFILLILIVILLGGYSYYLGIIKRKVLKKKRL